MKTELSDGEWTLMKALWGNAPVTTMQLVALLQESTGWTKHTVISMLKRLEEKGVISSRSNGRSRVYTPLLAQEDATRRETGRFLNKVFNGRVGVMLHAMLDSQALSREDIQELSDLLDQSKEAWHDD